MVSSLLKEGQEYSGVEFNALNQATLVKLTNVTGVHNGMSFHEGLNVDPIPFNPVGECSAGGTYFCDVNLILDYITYSDLIMVYYYPVSIPDDARVYVEAKKFKADKIVLGKRTLLCELLKNDEDLYYYCDSVKGSRYADPVRTTQAVWDFMEQHYPHGLTLLPAITPKDMTVESVMNTIRKKKWHLVPQYASHVFTEEVIDALMKADYDFSSLSPHSSWTKNIWMHQFEKGFKQNATQLPDAMWDDEMKDLLTRKNLLDYNIPSSLPLVAQTREMWENYFLKNKKNYNLLNNKFCDVPMFIFLKQHGILQEGDIHFLDEKHQTREMWEDAIRRGIFKNTKYSRYVPARFSDSAMNLLLLQHGYRLLSDLSYADRKNAFSQELFDIYAEKKQWDQITLFPPSYFNQTTFETLFDAGFSLYDIPMDNRTSDMYLSYIRNRKITEFVEIPSHLLTSEIWEELVQVNVHNVQFVPPDLLSERMIQTAVDRKKAHYLPKDHRPVRRRYVGSPPERAITKRKKRKDWSRRR